MVHVTGLELALIPAGSVLAGVALGIGGQGWLDSRKERRAGLDARDQAIAELLTATVDIIQGAQALRGAYEGQAGWRRHVRRGAAIVSAAGLALPGTGAGPTPRTGGERSDVLDWRMLSSALDRLLAEIRQLDDHQRRLALDVAAVLSPRTARFYAAVSALTLGPDKEMAAAVRKLAPAVTGLVEVVGARRPAYDTARDRAQQALREFRDTADKRQR